MINTRFLLAAAAVLLASTQGCGWFDTLSPAPKMFDQDDGGIIGNPHGGEGGSGGAEDPIDPRAGQGGGGSGGSGGSGGEAGDPTAGEGGEACVADDPPDPPIDAECDAGCDEVDPWVDGFTWHPEARRFAITDESVADGEQPRAWLLANGGAAPHRLVANSLSALSDSWIDTWITGVTSSVAGVSFTEGGEHFERVFFTRAGRVQMLIAEAATPPDGGAAGASFPVEALPQVDGFTFEGGNLAAVTFRSRGDRTIAVLAPARHACGRGYCVFELSVGEGTWAAHCSDVSLVHEQAEIAGVVVGDEVHFYLRTQTEGLARIARTAEGSYQRSIVATPGHLAQSLAVVPSALEGRVELIVITDDGKLWTARPLATERTAPEWREPPPFKNGVLASTGPAAVAAVTTDNYGPPRPMEPSVNYRVTELHVIGDDGRLYQNVTDRAEAQRPWVSWYPVAAPGRDQYVRAIGATTSYAFGTYNLANALCVVGGAHATTLQEATTLYDQIFWRDHVRIQRTSALSSDAPFAEISSASGADQALIAAVQRSAAPPFSAVLFNSNDGAVSYESFAIHATAPGEPEVTVLQPNVRYGAGTFHFTAVERALQPDCSDAPEQLRRIVYRRGADPGALAAFSAAGDSRFVVGEHASARDPVLAVTEGARGATAHVLYRTAESQDLVYWRLPPGPSSIATTTLLTPAMPIGRHVLAAGVDEALYAASFDLDRVKVCQLPPNGLVPPAACSELTFAHPDAREIPFGASQPERQGACGDGVGPHYRCFRDDRPLSLAADTSPLWPTKHRLFVAYAADDGVATSIYVTSSRGGESISGDPSSPRPEWSAPIPVVERQNGDTRHYFDAEVTIDTRRGVTVTYSAIASEPGPDQLAHAYVAHASAGLDGTMSPFEAIEIGTWDPNLLPYDCVTQRWALGDYREAETVGARTLQLLREGEGHDSRWLSEYAAP